MTLSPWKRAERFARLLASLVRALRRREASGRWKASVARFPPRTRLVFERLEPRLLLSADPLGATAGYAFDEGVGTIAADATGHGLDGTLTNGAGWATGIYGSALGLDGVNDYVNLGNPAALQLSGSMTVSAWVNASAFPVDDAAVVSKRSGEIGFQLDVTKDTGPRTIGFKLTNSAGGQMFRYGATTLQPNTWYHITGVYDAATQSLHVYLNGQLDDGVLQGTVTASQQNPSANVTIGRRSGTTGFEFAGRIDDVRIADHALTQSQIQTDMQTPLGAGADLTPPAVQAINRVGSTPTNAGIAQWAVTFSESVTGVDAADFALAASGVAGATLTGVSGSGSVYTVTASTGTGNGSLGLNLVDDDSIQDAGANRLGGTGLGNGSLTGQSYSIDKTAPSVAVASPAAGATVSGTVTVTANASDNVGVVGVQFLLDGANLGVEDLTSPYGVSWNTTGVANGSHTLLASARDAAGNVTTSSPVSVTVANTQTAALVAGYAFDETSGTTAADASGHGITGTLTNGPTWTSGHSGNALALDGVNDYVNLGNPAALQLSGSMTVSAWVNASAFPVDDAAVVSKRSGEIGFQLDVTKDTGPRTIGFKLTNSAGGQMFRYGATTLQPNTWYHITGVYDAATQSLHVYLNGQLDDGVLQGTVTASQQNPSANVTIGRRSGTTGFEFAGRIDDVRIYDSALTQSQVQTDLQTPVGGFSDLTPPDVHLEAPADGAIVSDIVTVEAHATDDVAIAGVQFYLDGVLTGSPDTADPYALTWDTRTVSNGAHTLTARAYDTSGNFADSAPVTVNVSNISFFTNEVLATGFDLPTAIEFLPDGSMLVVELAGTLRLLPAPYTEAAPTPFLQLTNVGSAGVQQGIYDIALDPNFAANHYYYLYYTAGTPNHDRMSRFTANAALTGTVAGSELILYEDGENANAEHHGGAINFDNQGMILLTTGEHFNAAEAQDLTRPRGKILRISPVDGSAAPGNPFSDGPGGNDDRVWALGLRNPYRAYYDAATDRLLIGDVGGNDYSTAIEEVDLGIRGANYGWPNVEAPDGNPAYTAPLYYYPHDGRDAAITGGFVYHGSQFPSSYQGSYFFADYTQNWIRRLTFDASGAVSGVFDFEPADGGVDGPYGDIVYLTEGPEGALYYVDLGYSDISATFGVSKIRRISFINSDLPPVVAAVATPSAGPVPLTVEFSSAGSSDPEGQPLTYLWTFGDGQTSTAPDAQHTYATAGIYQARLTVSDGVNDTLSPPISISVGNSPVVSLVTTPSDGNLFRAGDLITFSGDATDAEDGALPASAFTWNIDFLHEGHVHPGTPITGVKSGSFTIPTTGHDFSGFTRYRITLTVTDSDGLQSSQSSIVFPDKVNLSFDSAPGGLTLYLDGIAHTGPFVYDTLIGFDHTIEARDQTVGTTAYTFSGWSDGGAQVHTLHVPVSAQSFVATFSVASDTAPPSAPANLQATGTTATTAGLSWAASTDNVGVAGYNVYRNGALVGSTAETSFTDTGLSPATGYAYTVRAFDAADNLSQPSAALNVTTPAAAIAFVQQNYATPQTPQAQVSVSYTAAQTAGNTNILIVGWNDTVASITSITDSAGNVYQVAVPTFRGNGMSQAIYYAPNIKNAAPGSNVITVTFDQPAVYVDVRAAEYAGLLTANSFDVGASATGTGTSANSGTITTSASRELLIGAGMTSNAFARAGAGFTLRVITDPDRDILEDRSVAAVGTYSASASLSSGAWIMQIASFKGL